MEFPLEQNRIPRGQLVYPLDRHSEGALRRSLEQVEKSVIRQRTRFPLHLDTTMTEFNVGSDYMVMTADSTTTIARIGGGREGQILTLQFADSNIAITNDSSEADNTVNLTNAFTSSQNAVMQVLYDGTSWREVSRAINDT